MKMLLDPGINWIVWAATGSWSLVKVKIALKKCVNDTTLIHYWSRVLFAAHGLDCTLLKHHGLWICCIIGTIGTGADTAIYYAGSCGTTLAWSIVDSQGTQWEDHKHQANSTATIIGANDEDYSWNTIKNLVPLVTGVILWWHPAGLCRSGLSVRWRVSSNEAWEFDKNGLKLWVPNGSSGLYHGIKGKCITYSQGGCLFCIQYSDHSCVLVCLLVVTDSSTFIMQNRSFTKSTGTIFDTRIFDKWIQHPKKFNGQCSRWHILIMTQSLWPASCLDDNKGAKVVLTAELRKDPHHCDVFGGHCGQKEKPANEQRAGTNTATHWYLSIGNPATGRLLYWIFWYLM